MRSHETIHAQDGVKAAWSYFRAMLTYKNEWLVPPVEWVGTGILVPEAEVRQAGYRRADFRNVPLTCVPLPAVENENGTFFWMEVFHFTENLNVILVFLNRI